MAQEKKDIGRREGEGSRASKKTDKPRLEGPRLEGLPVSLAAKLARSADDPSSPTPPPLPGPGGQADAKKDEKASSEKRAASGAPKSDASATAKKDEPPDKPSPPELTAEEEDASESGSRRRSARRRPAGPVRERFAANDDVPSIGGLIYALQQKPSSAPFKYAAIASVVWALIGLGFGWFAISRELTGGMSFSDVLATPTTFLTLTGIVVPIAIIWFLSVLAWRAEELRLRSSTMTEVAVRLAEPDRLAEQSVASLGQAVRRQVSFMNDAVSRALGRAGELEALVHNEVAALEHSYEDNERKIRGLINELANERTALVGSGGEFAENLRAMSEEVPALIDKLTGQQSKLAGIISSAGDNLTALETSLASSADRLEGSLGERTEKLQSVLENYSGNIDKALGERTIALQETLGDRTEEMRSLLGDYTSALANALGARTEQMEIAFGEHLEALDASIEQRTDSLTTVFEEYAKALDSTLANRAQALDSQLVERTRALDDAFNKRLELFDDSIMRSTRAIDDAVGEKALALTSALDSHAKTFRETISQQSADLDESLVHGISAVRRSSENITRQSLKAIEGLASQSDLLKNVSENLLRQINTVSNRFDNQTQSIMTAANALETANYKIDSTLRTRHTELSQTLDRMSGKADEFGKFIEGYSTSIEGSLSDAEQRARAAAEDLKAGAETQQKAVLADFDRLRADAKMHSSRALEDLRKNFSSVSDELAARLGSISDSVEGTTDDLRQRAARAASEIAQEQERLKAELAAIPTTAREGTEAMRRALQDQLRALERLSDISNNQAKRFDVSPPVSGGGAPLSGDAGGSSDMASRTGAPNRTSEPETRGLSSLSSSVARELAARGTTRDSSVFGSGTAVGAGQRAQAPSSPGGGQGRGARPGQVSGTPPGRGGQDVRGEGWSLGDLLHRASFDDDGDGDGSAPASQGSRSAPPSNQAGAAGRPTPPGAPKRSDNGFDLAQLSRAIEPATAAGVWERLRRGQRGFLTRDMYTPEGRIVFDDIGYRLQSDENVRASVRSYLSDFEAALRKAEQSDPSGQSVQNHLLSDPGRVYLFLAHVSGRLG